MKDVATRNGVGLLPPQAVVGKKDDPVMVTGGTKQADVRGGGDALLEVEANKQPPVAEEPSHPFILAAEPPIPLDQVEPPVEQHVQDCKLFWKKRYDGRFYLPGTTLERIPIGTMLIRADNGVKRETTYPLYEDQVIGIKQLNPPTIEQVIMSAAKKGETDAKDRGLCGGCNIM